METKALTVLSISEQDKIAKTVVEMIKKAPFYYGEKIQISDLSTGGLGIFPSNGSVYLKRFLSGSFVGRYAFHLRYRIRPGSDSDKLAAQEYLEKVACWLEGEEIEYDGKEYRMEMPELSGQRIIQRIERSSVVNLSAVFQDGDMDFSIGINFDYLKKK